MSVAPPDTSEDIEAYLRVQRHKRLLRFITCGSVDDGKSTLIGRLLYESKLIYDDQLTALEADSRQVGTQGGALDFALLVDGLAAEREQGITIDVAYRFFATERRKFIVADTPGHEQYTRNMVTGASTADVAVILVDVCMPELDGFEPMVEIGRLRVQLPDHERFECGLLFRAAPEKQEHAFHGQVGRDYAPVKLAARQRVRVPAEPGQLSLIDRLHDPRRRRNDIFFQCLAEGHIPTAENYH